MLKEVRICLTGWSYFISPACALFQPGTHACLSTFNIVILLLYIALWIPDMHVSFLSLSLFFLYFGLFLRK